MPPHISFHPYLFIFFCETQFLSVAQADMQWHDLSSCNLHLLCLSNSHASASQVAGITGACHHAQLIFVFLLETRKVWPCYPDRSQTHRLKQFAGLSLPKSWDYRHEPPHPASSLPFNFTNKHGKSPVCEHWAGLTQGPPKWKRHCLWGFPFMGLHGITKGTDPLMRSS